MSSTELVQVEGRELWEKLKVETGKAWAAFVMFRDLGPTRTLPSTVASLGGSPGLSMLQEWSSKFHWFERAEAYDLYMDRRYREQRESSINQAENAERGLALLMERAVAERIRGKGRPGDADYVPPFDIATLTAADLARWFTDSVRVRRLSDGQATDMLKGAMLIRPEEATRLVQAVIEAALPLIPEELHERFITQVQAIAGGR